MASWLYRTTPCHGFNHHLIKICLHQKKKKKKHKANRLIWLHFCTSESWNLMNLFMDALSKKMYLIRWLQKVLDFQCTVNLIWHSLWAGTRSYANTHLCLTNTDVQLSPHHSTLREDLEVFKICAEALNSTRREAGPSGWCSHTRSLQCCDLQGPRELLEML